MTGIISRLKSGRRLGRSLCWGGVSPTFSCIKLFIVALLYLVLVSFSQDVESICDGVELPCGDDATQFGFEVLEFDEMSTVLELFVCNLRGEDKELHLLYPAIIASLVFK